MELKFRRKMSVNRNGYHYIHIPPAIAEALNCQYVDLVCDGRTLVMIPAQRHTLRTEPVGI